MSSIYQQQEKAFANVGAYVLMYGGEVLGRITIKYGARVTAYVHIHGTAMVKGTAGGGGYDRTSAAIINAAATINATNPHTGTLDTDAKAFAAIMVNAQDGLDWETVLRKAGYVVLRAI